MRVAWDVRIPDWQNMSPWEQEHWSGPEGHDFPCLSWQSKIVHSEEGNIYPHGELWIKKQFALGRHVHAYTQKDAMKSGLIFSVPRNHVWLYSSLDKKRPSIEYALHCVKYCGHPAQMMLLPMEEKTKER